jgi:hypothetical protein
VLAAAEALGDAERRREVLDETALGALAGALDRRLRGEFGEGAAGGWIREEQQRVRRAWVDGMQALARQHARAGRHAAGAAALSTLVAREPLHEGAHRELMALWAAAGRRDEALAHYRAPRGPAAARGGRRAGARDPGPRRPAPRTSVIPGGPRPPAGRRTGPALAAALA